MRANSSASPRLQISSRTSSPLNDVALPWSFVPLRLRRTHIDRGFEAAHQLLIIHSGKSFAGSISILNSPGRGRTIRKRPNTRQCERNGKPRSRSSRWQQKSSQSPLRNFVMKGNPRVTPEQAQHLRVRTRTVGSNRFLFQPESRFAVP